MRNCAKILPVNQEFKASTGWRVRMMRRNELPWQRTSLCQKLLSDFKEKLLEFQKHVIGLQKANNYLLSQIGNADKTPVYPITPLMTKV
jgi:hypothetical protein